MKIYPYLFMLLMAALVGASASAMISYYTISNNGKIKTIGVGVYWNITCTNIVSTIDWGTVEPGSLKNVTVYIRNEGNSVSNLSISTNNWNPSTASSYISLSWNYSGQQLSPNQIIQVKLTLATSKNIQDISNFNFGITVMATS